MKLDVTETEGRLGFRLGASPGAPRQPRRDQLLDTLLDVKAHLVVGLARDPAARERQPKGAPNALPAVVVRHGLPFTHSEARSADPRVRPAEPGDTRPA